MDELKWTSKTTIDFLNMFQNYPCLWDASSKDFSNRRIRDAYYHNLVDDLLSIGIPCTIELVRRKIKSLRDTYRKELYKVLKSKKKSVRASEVYKTKLVWFSAANVFWRRSAIAKKSPSNLSIQQCSSPEGERELSCNSYIEKTVTKEEMPEMPHADPLQSASSTSSRKHLPSQMLAPQRTMTLKCPQGNKQLPSKFENGVNKFQRISEVTTADTEDQYYQFAQHIAFQLRELPLRNFVLLQSKIQDIITEERLSSLHADPLT